MNIDISVSVPMQRVYDVIVNALDSGCCGPWADFKSFVLPRGFDVGNITWLDEDARGSAKECRTIYFAFLVEGGHADVKERGGPNRRVTLSDTKRGLALMAKVCPEHFAAILSGSDDRSTADALMQCIVLYDDVSRRGDIIYG